MPDPLEVPIGCPGCGGWLTVVVGTDPRHKPEPWQCPYCHKPQVVDLGGPIRYVVKRSDSPPTSVH